MRYNNPKMSFQSNQTSRLNQFYFVFSPQDLWYQMMLPPNFKKSQKYPLLIDVWVLGSASWADRPPPGADECFGPVQVRRPLQPAGELSLQAQLGDLPLQHTWDYCGQLRREGEWLPRRRHPARHLPPPRDLRSGRPDHGCEVTDGRQSFGSCCSFHKIVSYRWQWYRTMANIYMTPAHLSLCLLPAATMSPGF